MVRKHSPPEIRLEGPFGQFSKVSTQVWAFLKNLVLKSRLHIGQHSVEDTLQFIYFLLPEIALTFFEDPNFVRPVWSPRIFFVAKKVNDELSAVHLSQNSLRMKN